MIKYILAFLLGVACGAAALVVMSCIVVGKMADEDQIFIRYIERKNEDESRTD